MAVAMQGTCEMRQEAAAEPVAGAGPIEGSGRMLLGVFQTLDRAGIPYCVTHGYDDYPRRISSDVDCILSDDLSANQVAELLSQDLAGLIGAELVVQRGRYFVLADGQAGSPPAFLALDLDVDSEVGGLKFYSGREVLEGRRRRGHFWVPA